MTDAAVGRGLDYQTPAHEDRHNKILFWGCFIALITTAFGFITRMFLLDTWAVEFNLDPAQTGRLAGIGIWPFAVSIIFFSLIIDRIGYKTAMVFSFLGYLIWSIMGVSAYYVSKGGDTKTAYQLLYWGSLILGLSNGTVEAYINPVVATLFTFNKTKWLNILHAGWPGGLVLAGVVTIAIEHFAPTTPWSIKLGIIAVPAVIFFLILVPLKFPVQERVAAGVSYRDMLAEFGILGALVVGFLLVLQLMDFFSNSGAVTLSGTQKAIFILLGLIIVGAFGGYTRSFGRPFMFIMILIMIPLATTELGTDGWITGIMAGVTAGKFHSGWILIYTSFIMMVLRFCAGPIVHSLSPLGLLTMSAILAIAGLTFLANAGVSIALIFAAATLYACGKTFFWPTMLGVVSDQTPRGGALTLNALGGIGMLAVGVLGFPFIGALQANKKIDMIAATPAALAAPDLVINGQLTPAVLEPKKIYEVIPYQVASDAKIAQKTASLTEDQKKQIADAGAASSQRALANMAVFPGIMLVFYIALLVYFKSKGGYKAQILATPGSDASAPEARFSGGVPAPVE
jgi:MFS family permease